MVMRSKPNLIRTDGAVAGDGMVYDPVADKVKFGPVLQGLTSDDASVTITDNGDGTLDLAASGGGGGGGVNLKDRRWVPATSDVVIDEFRDGVTGATWTRVDASGGAGRVTWVQEADVLSSQQAGGDATGELHGRVVPLSSYGGSVAAGDAFYTWASLIDGANYTFTGIVLADGTTHGAGNQLVATWHNSRELYCRVFTNWNNVVSSSGAITSVDYQLFFRVVYTGSNVWRVDMSRDGVGWRQGGTRTLAFTPTHVGLIASSWGVSGSKVGTYEFLRRATGVT